MSELKREELLKEAKEVFDHYFDDLRDYPSEVIVKQAYEQIKALIQKPGEKKGLTGMAGEIFNEAHKNQPRVTEEWYAEKAKMFTALAYKLTQHEPHLEDHHFNHLKVKDFIRSLVESIPAKKATVDKEFIERWMDVLSWSAISFRSGQIDISGDDLKQMLAEAGVEVEESGK